MSVTFNGGETHLVTVDAGQTGSHVISPNNILANPGDIIIFVFRVDEGGSTGNHSIVQTSAQHPCSPLAGGFSSPLAVAPDAAFSIEILDTSSPIYFACGSTGSDAAQFDQNWHCQMGEVGVINPAQVSEDNDSDVVAQLLANAEGAVHDPAMAALPAGGSGGATGVGARVLGYVYLDTLSGTTKTSEDASYSTPPGNYNTETQSSANGSTSYIDTSTVAEGNTEASSTSSASSTQATTGGGHHLAAGAIAGIVIGVVVLLVLIAAALYRAASVRQRKKKTTKFARRLSIAVDAKEIKNVEVDDGIQLSPRSQWHAQRSREEAA